MTHILDGVSVPALVDLVHVLSGDQATLLGRDLEGEGDRPLPLDDDMNLLTANLREPSSEVFEGR